MQLACDELGVCDIATLTCSERCSYVIRQLCDFCFSELPARPGAHTCSGMSLGALLWTGQLCLLQCWSRMTPVSLQQTKSLASRCVTRVEQDMVLQVGLWVKGQDAPADAHAAALGAGPADLRASFAKPPPLPESQAAMLNTWITNVPHLPPPELEFALSAAAWRGKNDSKIVMVTSGTHRSIRSGHVPGPPPTCGAAVCTRPFLHAAVQSSIHSLLIAMRVLVT